ncbi:MAG TPA: bifunctional (p)ppGpp synthetase/guanosine-3',5'-bis(diphosphate) 3'-pyrophosphohydrolase [Actinomycetota bacterium]|nr:bifunctional (p)ppGpp synthetase/guanosine-3',5'-bis(diphosphate) 3'-pyrophosphohydrolase [Actinomycetota bacterium]
MEELKAPDRRGGLLSRLPFVSSGAPEDDGGVDLLLRKVRAYNPKADVRQVQRAFDFAEESHRGQVRKSGEPFIRHPLGVAHILADLGMDTTTLVAALLHDVVEDTDLSLEAIETEFGAEVGAIVDGLTKLDRIEYRTREQEQAENVRKMVVAMARDIRVLIIKLADRLHNMRTLEALPHQRQEEIATETLEIYAPLAHRLGIFQIKWELEDLSFKTMHPKRFEEIRNLVGKAEDERTDYTARVLDSVTAQLRSVKVKAEVDGRPKHLYSVYEKMVLRGKEFSEIYDLVGIRVLVETVKDCYAALGAIHSIWKPVPGRFKDYIAMPKFNMYQSLHTTVIGPEGRPLEVQIRTQQMHRTAEFGIAAHWRYKESGKRKEDASDIAWLAQMLEWQKDMADPREFMEGLRIDLYNDRAFCFTPKGDVVDLPAEATPIDFAYAIHTEVGHRCIGAKVNRKLVPLDYRLQTGDTVDILTSKGQGAGPSRDWLQMVATPRARNKIRQWFSRERREDAMDTGRDMLQRELRKQGLPLKRLTTEETLARVAADLKYPSIDAMLVAVGEGHVSPQSVSVRLTRLISQDDEEEVAEVPPARPVRLAPRSDKPVIVAGADDLWVNLARCCTPVPGDEIVGFVTRGRGVSVHRVDCPNARALASQADRFIEVSWRPGKGTSFVVAVQVEALDRKKLLGDVATALAEHQINILAATSTVGKDRVARLRFTFELADITHLAGILQSVKRVDSVFDAYRVVPG